jgi:hypothetical protein
VEGVGFAPGITLQSAPSANGKAAVLFRMTTYTSPETLAGVIRKADPNYKPERDPDPSRPAPDPQPSKPSPTIDSPKGDPMIPQEYLFALIGAAISLVAGRLGIPIFTSTPRINATTLRDAVRQHLLDILKGLSQPPADPDAELRKQMAAIAEIKSG